jgi:hypothetical protein
MRWRKIIKLRAAIHCCEIRKTLEKTNEAKTSKTWKTKNGGHKLQEPEMEVYSPGSLPNIKKIIRKNTNSNIHMN